MKTPKIAHGCGKSRLKVGHGFGHISLNINNLYYISEGFNPIHTVMPGFQELMNHHFVDNIY